MSEINLNTQPETLNKVIHSFNVIIPLICFYFLFQQFKTSFIWWILAILLVIPSILAFSQPKFIKSSYWASLTALLIVLFGTTFDLWNNLLEDNSINLANHLLALLASLLLAAILQMHTLRFRVLTQQSPTMQIAHYFKGAPLLMSILISCILVNSTLIIFDGSNTGFLAILENKLLNRGIIPPITLWLFYWGLFLLIAKWLPLFLQRNKEESTLKSLINHNTNKEKFFEICWQQFESFYHIPKYINWAIPILGFIGTVLGISLATEGLATLLGSTETNFSLLLSQALSPLGIAFDTTLIALTLSIILTLIQTLIYRWEEKQLLIFEQEESS